MTKILTEAVDIGNATARAIAFRPRLEGAYYYPNSAWATAFPGFSYEWLKDDGEGGRNLDSRTLFFYLATVNTPARVWRRPGIGSQYAYATTDSTGAYLDEAKSYKPNIPADVPAGNFWSVVVYDPQTRSELQTSQEYPSKNNTRDVLLQNADGSFDLFFGPTAPKDTEANWTQTVPGKGLVHTLSTLCAP
jgi:hypothetical protein